MIVISDGRTSRFSTASSLLLQSLGQETAFAYQGLDSALFPFGSDRLRRLNTANQGLLRGHWPDVSMCLASSMALQEFGPTWMGARLRG